MAISRASAKAKGRTCQNWTAEQFSHISGIKWGYDEEIAPREMGQSGVDIRFTGKAKKLFRWSVECKWHEKWSVVAWCKQAKENLRKGTEWLLITRKNRFDYIAILDANVFFRLLRLSMRDVMDKEGFGMIRINDEWALKTNALNILLLRKSKNKKEEETDERWATVGYYQDFKHALEALVDHNLFGEGIITIESIATKQDEMKEALQSLAHHFNVKYGIKEHQKVENIKVARHAVVEQRDPQLNTKKKGKLVVKNNAKDD